MIYNDTMIIYNGKPAGLFQIWLTVGSSNHVRDSERLAVSECEASMAARKDDTKKTAAMIRAYIAAQPPRTRVTLRKMRETIHAAAPGAIDGFSYRIPAVKLDGKSLIWYAGFTNHTSLFPIGAGIRRKLAKELAGYETSTGTVRFPLDKALPVNLVKRLVKARVQELRAKA